MFKEKGLDLLLVNPSDRQNTYGCLGEDLSAIEPPLLIGLLSNFIRQRGFSVRIIDADAEGWSPEYTAEKIIECKPLLVGIAVLGANPSASSTPKMPAASRILSILRDRNVHFKTLLFGIHPSALPEKTLREEKVDFVCRGECFYAILKLLKVLKSNGTDFDIPGLCYKRNDRIILNGWGELVKNLDELPFVAWDLLPMDKYRAHNWHCFGKLSERKPYAVIYTSLGCPFNCTYCNIHTLYNGKPGIRYRSPQKVAEEIDFLVNNYKVKNIKFFDELFILDKKRVEEICNLLIERNYDLNIWAYGRIDTVDKDILRKMKQAGINWLAFGIESGSERVRRSVTKSSFDNKKIKEVIEMTHQAGIYIVANFIFGLYYDDWNSMQETLNLAKELNCEYTNFYVAMAYPGSKLYEQSLRKGIELPDNWYGYAQFSEHTFPLSTKYLSNSEVLAFRDKAFYVYHSNPQYLKMIKDKFGIETVEHIKKMLQYKIPRRLLVEKR